MATGGLLLDTHVFLWWKLDDPRLSSTARTAIANAELVCVSAASAWEIAIKAHLGKIVLEAAFAAGVAESGFAELPLRFAHAEETSRLPLHHPDPFDRMLLAQARIERLRFVTHDHNLSPYDADFLWS